MIKGTTITLRALEIQDVRHYHLWINDEETNFWRGLHHPMSAHDAEAWILSCSKPTSEALTFAIISNDTSEPVGLIGLRKICARSRRAEIWIYIGDKQVWNKGIATQSISVMVDYAFNEMNLHRIWLECNPEHTAAVRCYEKIGFQKEGLLKEAYFRRGRFRDTCIMGLLRQH